MRSSFARDLAKTVDDSRDFEEAVLQHLQEVAHVKRAMLQTAVRISNDYPSDAAVLLRTISALTRSADTLLGDTVTVSMPLK